MSTFSNFVLVTTLAFGLSACASPQAETDLHADAKLTVPMTTVKPGADVTLNSALPKDMVAGSFQTVRLSLTDGYADGILSMRVEPSEGLRLFGGNSSKTFNMAKSGAHDWDVDVAADADGVYFLNVFADANGMPRSFSVRLNIGQVTQKMFDDAMPADGELVEGGKVRALEATETIK